MFHNKDYNNQNGIVIDLLTLQYSSCKYTNILTT
jgi:hypothetical protein